MLQRANILQQYASIHFGETLCLERLVSSIGSVGDAYNNTLAETAIGLFKTECYRIGSPFLPRQPRTLTELKDGVATWVHRFNTSRLMHCLGSTPPWNARPPTTLQQAPPTR